MAQKKKESAKGSKKETLLEVRREAKRRKPKFIRVDAHKHKRLDKVWRRPKGRHTKMREQKRGARKRVEPGFRSPALVRGLSRSGYEQVIVYNLSDLEALNPKTQAALLSRQMGTKKKVDVVKAAIENNITLLNLRNPAEFLKSVEQRFAKKKAAKAAKEAKDKKKKTAAKSIEAVVEKEEAKPAESKPAEKKAPAKKKAAAKKKEADTPEEQEKVEQKKRDKVLTKKK